MDVEVQEICVYYKGVLLQYKKDYDIINNQIIFRNNLNKRFLRMRWKTIKKENNYVQL